MNKTLKSSTIFIYAEHSYEQVRREIDWAISIDCPLISWARLLTDSYPGVVKAIKEAFGIEITLNGSVWIYQRKVQVKLS